MQQLSFDAKLELLQQFVQQHKRLPRGREEYQGVKLGQCCDNWRQRKRRLQPDQVEALATVDGWSQAEATSVAAVRFDQRLQLLKQFLQQHDRLPRCKEEYQGVKLGRYCDRWRHKHREGQLQPDQVEALDAVDGWSWEVARGPKPKK